MEKEATTFVVIGGGISGVTCVEQLSLQNAGPHERSIILLTASPLVKSVSNVQRLTRVLEEFDVHERSLDEFSNDHPTVRVVHKTATKLDPDKHEIHTNDGSIYRYRKLCLCTGGRPKIIPGSSEYVLGIRDTETVKEFQSRLKDARRIVIVGNGGIATELVYEIEGCQVIWAIKDRSIGATFFDPGAAQFFLPKIDEEQKPPPPTGESSLLKRHKYGVESASTTVDRQENVVHGVALGPDWSSGLDMKGGGQASHDIVVQYGVEVESILTPDEFMSTAIVKRDDGGGGGDDLVANPLIGSQSIDDWKVYVKLTNGKIYGCDFVISATGVTPNSDAFSDMETAEDGGLKVNEFMETSAADVYAAGDVCSANWSFASHWFQMRLWTQAKQMGSYAAKCMSARLDSQAVVQDFCFEIFTHATRFFGYKVILLGLYNGQGLGTDYDILLRTTKGSEYVKAVMQNGRMRGAVLVGETDLEETFENLILNQMDLSSYGAELLNPNIDIEDYFD